MRFDSLLKNKWTLYVILGLAITNIFGYLALGNNDALILFFVIGVLTSYFSKNMIVIILSSMLLTNLLIVSKNGAAKISNNREGLENPSESKESDHSSENGSPKAVMAKKDQKPRIDQAATFQQAYLDLENNLGPEQMQSLKSDTQDLIKTQQQLGQSIKEIGPLINTANNMMQMMGSAGAPISKLLEQVQGLLGNAQTTSDGKIDVSKIDLKGISEQAQTLAEQSKQIADSQAAERR